MPDKWYFGQNGMQKGPVALEALQEMAQRGEVRTQDLVWHEGLSDWKEAGSVAEIFPAAEPIDLANAPDPQTSTAGATAPPLQLGYYVPASALSPNYAGFWWRVLAAILDGVLMAIVLLPISVALDFIFGLGQYGSSRTATPQIAIVAVGINIVIQYGTHIAYYGLMESSRHQATLGKLACGLYVTDIVGARVSLGKAMCRYLASLLSGIILCVGYLMGAFTQKKQCLHDILCGTLVIKR